MSKKQKVFFGLLLKYWIVIIIVVVVLVFAVIIFWRVNFQEDEESGFTETERFLVLTNPSGGEEICKGAEYAVTWESKGVEAVGLNIMSYQGIGGITRYPLDTLSADYNEADVLTGGSLVWKVGETKGGVNLKEGRSYKIEIKEIAGNSSNGKLQDESNEFFSIVDCPETDRYIEVLSPNGGESFCLRDEVVIKWKSNDVDAVVVRLIKYSGNNESYYILNESSPADSYDSGEKGVGAFNWEVGMSRDNKIFGYIQEGYSFKIEILSSDGEEFTSDVSDKVFSILNCEG